EASAPEPLVHLELVEEDHRVAVDSLQLVRVREARELAVDFRDPDVEVVQRQRASRLLVGGDARLVTRADLLQRRLVARAGPANHVHDGERTVARRGVPDPRAAGGPRRRRTAVGAAAREAARAARPASAQPQPDDPDGGAGRPALGRAPAGDGYE